MKTVLISLAAVASANVLIDNAAPQQTETVEKVIEQPLDFSQQWLSQPVQQVQQTAPQAPAMDPLMLMMLMKDGDDSMSKMLPFLMMSGQNGAQGMDPMMMMMLMGDDDSDMSELLPLMMMGGQQQMDPMMMMTLMDSGSCSVNDELKSIKSETLSKDDLKKLVESVAAGDKFFVGDKDDAEEDDFVVIGDLPNAIDEDVYQDLIKQVDYKYQKCKNGKGSGMSSMLPFMMGGNIDPMMMMLMGDGDMDPMMMMMLMGQGNQQQGKPTGGMDPMMMMMLMGDGDIDPMMMMMLMGQGQQKQTGGMDPLMMMMLMGDDKSTEEDCSKKFGIKNAFTSVKDGNDKYALSVDTDDEDIRDVFADDDSTFPDVSSGVAKDFNKCINDADEDDDDSDSKFEKLLPFLMMSGGQQMDPMMMMLMMGDL